MWKMDNPIDIGRLCEDEPDLALALSLFAEIERIYRESLTAMGLIDIYQPEIRNTAEVTISLDPTPLTSAD